MKTKIRLVLPAICLVVAGILLYRFVLSGSRGKPNVVRVSGNIEVTDAEVSFKIAGRVEERLVSEGQSVSKGDAVARLDDSDLVQEVALRRAEVRAAEAALAELQAGSRPEEVGQAEAVVMRARARLEELLAGSRPQEIAAAEAALQRAKAEADRLRVEFERAATLHSEGVIAPTDFDRAQMEYQVAAARAREAGERLKLIQEGPREEEILGARAELAEAEHRYALVRKGPREEAIEQARARLEQAKAALSLAEVRLSYATLRCPLSGVVLSDNVEPGEYVAPGTPVVTVGALENVWLRAYISETDLGRVKLGQRVRVTADTYPGKVYEGVVSFIASEAEFTPKNVQTKKERVKLVYRIKVSIANPKMELKPGMPADAEVLLDE